MISKEEIYNLYIIQNKSRKEMLELLNIGITTFKRLMRKYNIKKLPKQMAKNRLKTNLEKYGAVSYTATSEGRAKISNVKKNMTLEEKALINEKRKQTCLKKYGVDNIQKVLEIKRKTSQTNIKKYGGTGFASKELNSKVKKVMIEKYGVENPSQLEEIKIKKLNTKKKNKCFHGSSYEEIIFKYLKVKYPDVQRQYRSDLYPFACDFYIPELDLYIEYQGNWTHGKYSETKIYGPYDSTNPEHQAILDNWSYKLNLGYSAYKSAINVWTIRDPLKRKTAKENNLNWLEFFTLDEFMEWYKDQKKETQ